MSTPPSSESLLPLPSVCIEIATTNIIMTDNNNNSDADTNHHQHEGSRRSPSPGAGADAAAEAYDVGPAQQEVVDSFNNNIPVFLDRTFRMIETLPDDVVCWSEAGDSFIIKQVSKYVIMREWPGRSAAGSLLRNFSAECNLKPGNPGNFHLLQVIQSNFKQKNHTNRWGR